jgi:hypothetical protein
MSVARMANDQQVVEAVLRDKDLEWFHAQGTGKHSSKERTTQRAKLGSDVTHTIRRACTTRHVRVRRGGVTQGGNTIVHSKDRSSHSAQASPQGEANLATD